MLARHPPEFRQRAVELARLREQPVAKIVQTFDRAVRRLALPKIRLHDLRHSHATLGLGAGVPIKVMSDGIGHATTSFTMDVYMMPSPPSRTTPPT